MNHKIKLVPIRIDTTSSHASSKHLGYFHDKFLHGRPDLLMEIKHANELVAWVHCARLLLPSVRPEDFIAFRKGMSRKSKG